LNAVARTAGLLAIAVFGVLVATAFNRTLDDRLETIPGLSPEIRAEVNARRADLAAADLPPTADPQTAEQLDRAIDEAFVAGFRLAMIVGADAALVGALIAWRLVEGKVQVPAEQRT
jgi:hypothetical protein